MRANLPQLEETILQKWAKENLHQTINEQSQDWPTFLLHDGPPYANGHLHMGHALNKILKDMIIKYKRFQKNRVPYVAGWDCHGLPIEWKVEEKYRAQKKNKDDVPVIDFRAECRNFAKKWVEIQKEEFGRLGIICNWDDVYLTMNFETEALIVKELHRVLMNGVLYKGLKPVQWSVIEKTALAEAEIEYKEKTSSSLYVLFPIKDAEAKFGEKVSALIWTTTPWTIPANRAIAYMEDASYVVVKDQDNTILIAKDLVADLEKITERSFKILRELKGIDLEGLYARHPLQSHGYDFSVPLLAGTHVTLEQGTGLVHTAPSHGIEDFDLGKAHGLEVPELIGGDGIYYDHVPYFGGHHIFKADNLVIDALKAENNLFYDTKIKHSYAHSWRSKAPLIYRATSQWFIQMDGGLKAKALDAIDTVDWYPSQGKNRLSSMVKNRPDWCLSRQRSWGVPIALFVSKKTGEPLKDETVNTRIFDAMKKEGADVWYKNDPQSFLGEKYKIEDYEQVFDILDVWFESGTSHAFTLETNPNLKWPADLYLEGLDQHRGWFQSSLLHSVATRNKAPYKAVLTHGFVVDEKGYKMSKSSGNTVNLEDIIKKYGIDILRLWVASSDYFDDIRIGDDILQRQIDVYRKIRNTFRYLLGNLTTFDPKNLVDYSDLDDLEKWVLARLSSLEASVNTNVDRYNFHDIYKELFQFCVNDLSAFYFDIRKDRLYCDHADDIKRKGTQSVLFHVFQKLSKWLAPILTFTMEEAWTTLYPEKSIYEETFEACPTAWSNEALLNRFEQLRAIRRVVTGGLEEKRTEGFIRSSLEASVDLYLPESVRALINGLCIDDFMIVSTVNLHFSDVPHTAYQLSDVKDVGVHITKAIGDKCVRCWKILEDVNEESLCCRCQDVVSQSAL